MAISSDARGRAALFIALTASPVYYVLGVLRPRSLDPANAPSYDFYAYFYPNILHTIRSLNEGFGLFWNPYQNCGQPFFGFSLTALLHPPNWIFFVFDREVALLASIVLNIAIGGGGVWLLARELRVSPAGALAGAVAFQVSATVLSLGAWSPMHIGPYVWMPWALFAVERILRDPTNRHGIILAVVLAVQLLPGFPMTSLFTGQVIALRIVFALLTREVVEPRRLILPFVLGLGAVPLLIAVQYVSSIQVALDSMRASGGHDLGLILSNTRVHRLGLVMSALAALSLFGARRHTVVWFYLALGCIFAMLTLGEGTPLFDFYTSLPGGDLFVRRIGRFLWVTSFAASILVAIGVDQIVRGVRGAEPNEIPRRALLAVTMIAAPVLVYLAPTWGPVRFEWVGAVIALVFAMWGVSHIPGHRAMPWAICLVVAASGMHGQRAPFLNLRAGPLYEQEEVIFDQLAKRMTPQDRVLIDLNHRDFPLVQRSASIFRVPSIGDYEPQTSLRFAEYSVHLKHSREMSSLNNLLMHPHLPDEFDAELVNLSAARYLISPNTRDSQKYGNYWKIIFRSQTATIYQNSRATPRAFYVPTVRVLPRERILSTLSDVRHRPARVALVEEAPESGMRGSPGGRGEVEFVEDRGERIVLSVHASQAGFLSLADQYDSGWKALVNGVPTQILRSNYAFRVVEVPEGKSEVVFEYSLAPVYGGAAISLLTVMALCWVWRREAPAARHRIRKAPMPSHRHRRDRSRENYDWDSFYEEPDIDSGPGVRHQMKLGLFGILTMTTALLCPNGNAFAVPVLYSAVDDGAYSLGAAPNSVAMATAFDLASGSLPIIDFESGLPVGVSGGPGVITSFSGCGALCGYNTTVGGSAFFLAEGGSHTFSFSTPINSYGGYFTGVQYGSHTLTYTDGSSQILSLPAGDLGLGGTSFFGFIDTGASITSITLDVGLDIVSLDDLRVGSVVPEPTSFSLLGLGLIGLGLANRRSALRRFDSQIPATGLLSPAPDLT